MRFENKMKNFLMLSITFLILTSTLLAQDKYYTRGLANGYAWTAPPSASKLAYAKGKSLYNMLKRRKYQTQIQREVSFPLGCEKEMEELLESDSSSIIDLQTIEKMINKFYDTKENLIIPVLGAYCCCIKELAGESIEDIEKYRQELFEFSLTKLKQ